MLDTNQPAGIWSLVEMSIGLVCACLPVMRPLLQCLVPKWVTTLADSLDKTSLSWNNRHTPQRANPKTHRTSVSHSRPTLAKPESVRLSRMEPFLPEPFRPTQPDGTHSGKAEKTGIVKSVTYSSTWSCDEEKGIYGDYRSLP